MFDNIPEIKIPEALYETLMEQTQEKIETVLVESNDEYEVYEQV